MKPLKRYQQGDAGVTMVIVMVVMMLGFFGYKGMHSGDGHSATVSSSSPKEKTAFDILDEEYAHGESSREEYFNKREDLLKR